MNNIAHSISITNLPGEMHQLIVKDLTLNDIKNCMQVSLEWKRVFETNAIWEPIAEKYQAVKLGIFEDLALHQFILSAGFFFATPVVNSMARSLQSSYKSRVKQKISDDFRKTYPKEFFQIFGEEAGLKGALRNLPVMNVARVDLAFVPKSMGSVNYYFQNEYFISPIVIACIDNEDYCILLRIRNNNTGKIYLNAVGFSAYYLHYTPAENRIISIKDDYLESKKESSTLNRIQRLVQHKPVGMLIEKDNTIVEGPTKTYEGKSVLELC